jgi:ABC-type antimicrobial peptide transport system permease subunit
MTRRETRILYIVGAIAIIVIAFLLLGGTSTLKGMGHNSGSMAMTSLRWGQILISLGIGFLLGWLASRRRW